MMLEAVGSSTYPGVQRNNSQSSRWATIGVDQERGIAELQNVVRIICEIPPWELLENITSKGLKEDWTSSVVDRSFALWILTTNGMV